MNNKKKKLLVFVANFHTSFWYVNRELYYKHFDIDFIQKSHKESNETLPEDIIDYRYRKNWTNNINKLYNIISFYYDISKIIKRGNYDLVCLGVMPSLTDSLLFMYKLLPSRNTKFYLSLCTPLGNNKFLKTLFSWNLKLFKYVAGDTPLLRKELKLNNRKYLFRGNFGYSDRYGYSERDFSNLNLVYLGVFRKGLEKTIEGFSIFKAKYPDANISYSIIGQAKPQDAQIMLSAIKKYNLNDIVRFYGFLALEDVQSIFEQCNVGISFVPKFQMYEGVSITKTIEYQLVGMPVIGTDLSFNIDHITTKTGILHDDTAEDFATALEKLYINRMNYNSVEIRKCNEHLLSTEVMTKRIIPNLNYIISL